VLIPETLMNLVELMKLLLVISSVSQ
jgi:hypothetical protein